MGVLVVYGAQVCDAGTSTMITVPLTLLASFVLGSESV